MSGRIPTARAGSGASRQTSAARGSTGVGVADAKTVDQHLAAVRKFADRATGVDVAVNEATNALGVHGASSVADVLSALVLRGEHRRPVEGERSRARVSVAGVWRGASIHDACVSACVGLASVDLVAGVNEDDLRPARRHESHQSQAHGQSLCDEAAVAQRNARAGAA
jgi:hypothetical protein